MLKIARNRFTAASRSISETRLLSTAERCWASSCAPANATRPIAITTFTAGPASPPQLIDQDIESSLAAPPFGKSAAWPLCASPGREHRRRPAVICLGPEMETDHGSERRGPRMGTHGQDLDLHAHHT